MLETELVFLPGQQFECFDGLIGLGPVQASWWLRGNGLGRDHFLAPESVASRGDGDAFVRGIKVRFQLEFLAELLTSGFQQFHV